MRFYKKLHLLTFVSGLFTASSFSQNDILRFMFRKMTPDCKWPDRSELKKLDECTQFDPTIEFPNYYLKDFHAYTGGNMNPMAAREARSATSAVMNHHFENLSGDESSHYIRSIFSVITRRKNIDYISTKEPQKVVDFGCGIGVSTEYMRDTFREGNIKGVDLSPFFLDETSNVDAEFIHGNIENTGIEPDSIDVVSISYVLHELPYEVSIKVLQEAFRILKPGTGIISILDMHNPKASNLVMKYIFDRTEPYLQEYSKLSESMEENLLSIGFEHYEVSNRFPKTIMWFAKKL